MMRERDKTIGKKFGMYSLESFRGVYFFMQTQRRVVKMSESFIFSSESVTEGHPDKVADQISDSVLDAILKDDPMSRVACEVLVSTGFAVVAGEITTKAHVDIQKIARETIDGIGYNNADYGFDAGTCAVLTAIDEQSGDIAQGVNDAIEVRGLGASCTSEEDIARTGAGDQGMSPTRQRGKVFPKYGISMAAATRCLRP